MKRKLKFGTTLIDILQIVQIGLVVYLILQFVLYLVSIITLNILISTTLPFLIVYIALRSYYHEKKRKKRAEYRTKISKIIEIIKESAINDDSLNNGIDAYFPSSEFDELTKHLSSEVKENIIRELGEENIRIK